VSICKTSDGTFVISSRGCWLPGVYATERAGRYAFRFTDEQLSGLTERICAGEGRAITSDDLRLAFRPTHGTSDPTQGKGPASSPEMP
jgi:hypothetical protein